ncbi:Anti-sigma-K factor RskA [Nonomuraea coxensis DSM 45129]|uniref:Regulator of SigK n=1 Tax=Nonomuraea coxensis DSM 45129 TaxID=1122611 RepID=A0ABX8U0F9_9ACTN|nr:anti-sigma factor [Nonomuraea coxensis]QYC41148.1 Anti-sigma-K factor RskA [Nonomuraea coxensis DSM 45129]
MDDDLHALSGAYVVDALPYADWVLFEEHLRGCARCGTEVRRLRETAALLAEAVAVTPPPGLRPRLLAAATGRRPTPLGGGLASLAAARPWAGRAQGRAQGRGWVARVLAGGAAGCAAVAVGLGAVAVDARRDSAALTAENRRLAGANQRLADANREAADTSRRLADANREAADVNRQVAVLLAAPDVRTVRRPVASGGTATLVVSRSAARLLFTSSGLPALPESRAYELWLMGPDGPRPAGLLGRAGDGVTAPVVVTPLRGDERVALTLEPARGSPRPTTDPILLADLPAA